MRCVLELIPARTYVRAGPDSGLSASSARSAAAGLAVQRRCNGYAVPAGWGIPGLMKFDALYWWAGRLWGERFIMALPGSQRVTKHMGRVQRAGRKFIWPAVVVSSVLPIPRTIIYVIAGWVGMRLVTFLILDLIGTLLWAGLLAGVGYTLGHHAIVAAKTISHYSWRFTIGIVALSVLVTVRSHRRLMAAAAAQADQKE